MPISNCDCVSSASASKSALDASRLQGGEIYMRGDVLLAGRFIRRRRGHVPAVGHEGVAMAARQLFLARIAVVDQDQKPRRSGER